MPQLSEAFRTSSVLPLKRAGIVAKRDYEPAAVLAKTIAQRLEQHEITVSIDTLSDDLDVLIIVGGDGTLLHVADQAARHSIPVLGINMGHLGFLTERTQEEAFAAVDELISKEVTIENRMMLKVSLSKNGKKEIPGMHSMKSLSARTPLTGYSNSQHEQIANISRPIKQMV